MFPTIENDFIKLLSSFKSCKWNCGSYAASVMDEDMNESNLYDNRCMQEPMVCAENAIKRQFGPL